MSESFSKSSVRKAGSLIRKPDLSDEEFEKCIERINYWRKIHIEPMQSLMDIVYEHSDANLAAVSGRIKKLDTIIDKLKRLDNPNVTTIYDIAGCRIVVPDLSSIETVSNALTVCDEYNPQLSERHDYLKRPHPSKSGYRSRHLIFTFNSEDDRFKLNAELQIRTQKQHSWSTAVELYDRAVGTRLKFASRENDDNDAWIFFQRFAELIRMLENQEDIDEQAIRDRFPMKDSGQKALKILGILDEASQSTNVLEESVTRDLDYCIVDFFPNEQSIILTKTCFENAIDDYYAHEEVSQGFNADTVLIRGRSFEQLKLLYPNYFGDISSFINLVRKYLPVFY